MTERVDKLGVTGSSPVPPIFLLQEAQRLPAQRQCQVYRLRSVLFATEVPRSWPFRTRSPWSPHIAALPWSTTHTSSRPHGSEWKKGLTPDD
jgi:hypothetical protein